MLIFKTKTIGDFGEKAAQKYLRKNKYKILETNYKTNYGEIDIIAEKDKCICFVEVKTRSNESYGQPRDAVDSRKQKKIASVAKYYMLKQKEETQCRFDVIEIILSNDKQEVEKIEHIKDAFWC